MKPWTYDPTEAGELFELLEDEETVECKACATRLRSPTQQQLREHAEKIKETAERELSRLLGEFVPGEVQELDGSRGERSA